jgi:hypothetical protein
VERHGRTPVSGGWFSSARIIPGRWTRRRSVPSGQLVRARRQHLDNGVSASGLGRPVDVSSQHREVALQSCRCWIPSWRCRWVLLQRQCLKIINACTTVLRAYRTSSTTAWPSGYLYSVKLSMNCMSFLERSKGNRSRRGSSVPRANIKFLLSQARFSVPTFKIQKYLKMQRISEG